MELAWVWVCWICLCAYCAGAEPPTDLSHVASFLTHTSVQLSKKYRPLYHVSAPFGWLNDPAAFVYYSGKYHLFYQYYPYDGAWGPLRWGHAVSKDLVEWAHYPPALLPRDPYDRHGCLAGSVLVYNAHLAVFYTGEVLTANATHQTQNVAISSDGILFQKYLYNPVVRVPPVGASDFRNPKVWKYESTWYMMAGASVSGHGQLVLYTSPDLYGWRFNGTLARSLGDFGHLWESPDAFEVDGLSAVLVSARGVTADGFRFRNLHQSGYVLGRFDVRRAGFHELEVSTATFNELDYGHDFYAAKTMQAPDGRRLLVAWLGMWESEFLESDEGWAGCMTLVREVQMGSRGRLVTPPARELRQLRGETLEDAWYSPGEAFYAGVRAFELEVNASSATSDAAVTLEWGGRRRYTVAYWARLRRVSVDRGGADGERRADWTSDGALYWRIFVDRSSVEVYMGEGEVVFSSRVYPRRALAVRVGGETQLHVVQHRLRRSVGFDTKLKKYLKRRLFSEVSSNPITAPV